MWKSGTGQRGQVRIRKTVTGQRGQVRIRKTVTGQRGQVRMRKPGTGQRGQVRMRKPGTVQKSAMYIRKPGTVQIGAICMWKSGAAKKLGVLFCVLLLSFIRICNSCADDLYEGPLDIESFSDINAADIFNPQQSMQKYPSINAGAAIVMDFKSGRILFEKNAFVKRAMASTTKIMTAIVAIENGQLNDVVTVSKRAQAIWGSTLGLKHGEKYTLKELLYGLMLNSGNDAALAIAEHIGGTVENFVLLMNEKAEELGANDTFFQTPHGLDTPDHYTTAYDLALITRYALRNSIFSKIVSTVKTNISGISLYNTNELLGWYQGADGVKTGYTGKAGRCLVASAVRENMKLISVVLLCNTRAERVSSSKKILDYAFENYKARILLRENEEIVSIGVKKGIDPELSVKAGYDIEVPLTEDEFAALEKQVNLPEKLEAPVQAGVEIGYVKYVVNGRVIARESLFTEKNIARKDFFYYLALIVNSIRHGA